MVKVFFKTYYSIPDKLNRVDVAFERGYRNIRVLYNNKEVAHFQTASEILTSKEILLPDDGVINIRLLKEDEVDFEIFLNGVQIDNSSTSPAKVAKSLRFPVNMGLLWYGLALLFGFFTFRELIWSLIKYQPSEFIFNPIIVYFFTSTVVVLLLLTTNLWTIQKGNMVLYYIMFIAVVLDTFYSFIIRLTEFVDAVSAYHLAILVFFGVLLPLSVKIFMIISFYRSIKKYQLYANTQASMKRKFNSDLVDVQ
ncbi:MAG: hypothetical protein IPM74_00900 [Crocinitomicaceae bacterium]|nr:hypothetical protein [Crocinitomicaceae bacterium]MBK8924475.1 hypothetical protein [Crocinitomicaceae bacterium]